MFDLNFCCCFQIAVELPKPVDTPYPPPLAEALPDEMHRKFILKIPDEVPVSDEQLKEEAESPERVIEAMDSNKELVDELQKRFEGISVEDAKRIILEVTNDLLADLKVKSFCYYSIYIKNKQMM